MSEVADESEGSMIEKIMRIHVSMPKGAVKAPLVVRKPSILDSPHESPRIERAIPFAAIPSVMMDFDRHGLIKSTTAKVIDPLGAEQTVLVEYAPDPSVPGAMIARFRPAGGVIVSVKGPMMSTQEAADFLNVSRPYVVRLIEAGQVPGVEKTRGGQRRIPRGVVEQIKREMQTTRRKALDGLLEATGEARDSEDDKSHAPKRRWVAAR